MTARRSGYRQPPPCCRRRTGERDGGDAFFTRGFECGDDIAGIAAGRDADQHVTFTAQCFDLAGEDPGKAEIIAIGRNE